MASASPIINALGASEWVFPVFECVHIAAFALSIGMIALVDLRLLGLGMRHQTPAQLVRDTEPWTMMGLGIVIFSGPVLFLSDPLQYIHNSSFQFKMVVLLAAIVFNYTIHRRVALSVAPAMLCRIAGAVSLALWLSVIAGGLFIAFVPVGG